MGFWDKLGAPAQQRPQQRPPGVPDEMLPRGMQGNRQQAVDRYMQQQQYRQQEQFQPEAEDFDYVPTDPQDPHGYLTKRLHWRWRGNPKGGAGETERLGNCPSCGSARYFSRQNGGGVMNTNTGTINYPAPRCEDCGYPSEQGMIGIGAQVVGAGRARAAAAPPPPPGSLQALQKR